MEGEGEEVDDAVSSETAQDMRSSNIYEQSQFEQYKIDKSDEVVKFFEEDEDTGQQIIIPGRGYTMQPINGYIGIKLNTSGTLYNERAS